MENPKFDLGGYQCYDWPACGILARVTVAEEQCLKSSYPFHHGDTVLILGEIAKMPGHCVLVTKDGKTHFGYHNEYFTALKDDEI